MHDLKDFAPNTFPTSSIHRFLFSSFFYPDKKHAVVFVLNKIGAFSFHFLHITANTMKIYRLPFTVCMIGARATFFITACKLSSLNFLTFIFATITVAVGVCFFHIQFQKIHENYNGMKTPHNRSFMIHDAENRKQK